MVTVRDGEPAPDAVTALWKDLAVPRLGLTDLDRDEVGAALRLALGGDVSSSLVDDLARLSHGNPLLLRELVTAAARSGALGQRDGILVATGPLVGVDDLPAAVADRIERLAPPARASAELVALSEPVAAALVEELVPADVRASTRSGCSPPCRTAGAPSSALSIRSTPRPCVPPCRRCGRASTPGGWPSG